VNSIGRRRPLIPLRSFFNRQSGAWHGRLNSVRSEFVPKLAPPQVEKRKEPPGNRAALPLGRIVPTEAKPSELSGCIVGSGFPGVKDYSEEFNYIIFSMLRRSRPNGAQQLFRLLFAFSFPLFTGFLPGFLEFCTTFPQGIRLRSPFRCAAPAVLPYRRVLLSQVETNELRFVYRRSWLASRDANQRPAAPEENAQQNCRGRPHDNKGRNPQQQFACLRYL
jgi:hypothetical protein